MNKESAYEFGLQDNVGALQGAFNPGCWRWWGGDIIPLDTWTQVGVGVDGTNEMHYVNGAFTEQRQDHLSSVLGNDADLNLAASNNEQRVSVFFGKDDDLTLVVRARDGDTFNGLEILILQDFEQRHFAQQTDIHVSAFG